MNKIILDITMSLDGFVAGPNVGKEFPMGEGGLRLHDWIFGAETEADKQEAASIQANAGAVIVGGRTYHIAIDGPWGGVTPFAMPAFVVTNDVPEDGREGFSFVPEGIEAALAQAKATAGDKDIWVMGGANMIQQFLKAGLFDEFHLHVAPVVLCDGLKLFENMGTEHIELKNASAVQTPGATHLVLVKP